MERIATRRERATLKRRQAAITRALVYLRDGMAGGRLGTAERRIRAAVQPMTAAKALVKEWRQRRRPAPVVESRAVLICRAYQMELGHGWPNK